MLYIISKKRF